MLLVANNGESHMESKPHHHIWGWVILTSQVQGHSYFKNPYISDRGRVGEYVAIDH